MYKKFLVYSSKFIIGTAVMMVFAASYVYEMSCLFQPAEVFFRGYAGLMVCWTLKWQLK